MSKSCRRFTVPEVPALERDRIEPALDAEWLSAVTEYLSGDEPIDGDPMTDFDCSRDCYQEAA